MRLTPVSERDSLWSMLAARVKKRSKVLVMSASICSRRHAVVERGHHDYRHVDLGKQIHRHADDGDHADQRHHQAKHDDEERDI